LNTKLFITKFNSLVTAGGSSDEVLTSLDAYKKSLKNKIKVKDENPTITILAYSGKLYKDYG